MKSSIRMTGTGGRRMALFLVACALVLRLLVPAGWMPQANAAGIALAWCDDSGTSRGKAPAEARALFAKAVGEKPAPEHKPAPDQPCAFAAAAQALVAVDFAPLPPTPATHNEPLRPEPVTVPGRGLAAPPPRSTGPPILA